MPLETVTIAVLNDDVGSTPVAGVTVRVFDAAGTTFLTSDVTDGAGEVDFTLNGEAVTPDEYQIRGAKTGLSFPNPTSIEVWSPPANSPTGTNSFEITGHVRIPPESADPYLCRVSGIIRDGQGLPLAGIDCHFMPLFDPLIVEGEAILGERVRARSDALGYVEFDLYRNATYKCTLESHENVTRDIAVPGMPAVNFADLVFPVVAVVAFDPVGPLNLTTGDISDVTVVVTTSAGVELVGLACEDVLYTSDDPDIANVCPAPDGISLRVTAGAAGTTVVRASRLDESIIRVPDPGVVGGTITINVT
jgi:hypothetical protein